MYGPVLQDTVVMVDVYAFFGYTDLDLVCQKTPCVKCNMFTFVLQMLFGWMNQFMPGMFFFCDLELW